MQKIKVKGHSVKKLEWKRTNRRTDENYNSFRNVIGCNCITSGGNAACNRLINLIMYFVHGDATHVYQGKTRKRQTVGGVGSVVKRWSLAGGLSLSHARPAADGCQLGQLSLASLWGR